MAPFGSFPIIKSRGVMFIGIAIIVAVTGIGGIVLVMAAAVDNIIMDSMGEGE